MQLSLAVITITLLSSLLSIAHAKGNIETGKQKAAACEGCHGQNSKNPMAPKLAGQPQDYLTQQLMLFKNGSRKDPIMNGLAAGLKSKQDIEDIAAYYASLPYIKGSSQKTAIQEMGRLFYNNKCGMCHSGQGKINTSFMGSVASADNQDMPLIENQPMLYLIKALKDYRSGVRKSGNAFIMDVVAQRLTDRQINLVAKYLSGSTKERIKNNSIANAD